MRAQVVAQLAAVALAALAAGANVPKVSLANSWNSTSNIFQKAPAVTVTDLVKLPPETVYVTVTVAPDPTVGCIAPLPPPGNHNGGDTPGAADGGITSSETGVTVFMTHYFTVTETVPVVAVTKTPSHVPEHTVVTTSLGSIIPESTTRESTTTVTLTSTYTKVITVTPSKSAVSAPSSSETSTLRFSGIGPNGWNITRPTAGNAAASISASSFQYKIVHTGVPVVKRHLEERQADEWITATIDGVVVSWINTYNPTKPTGTSGASVATSAGFTPSPTPSDCGEIGNFTINFDHLPVYSPPPGIPESYPPIFSPYYHFMFSTGWSYGKSFRGFVPVSLPHMAIFRPETQTDPGLPEDLKNGARFGAGQRLGDSAFWFNAYSLSFGCPGGSTSETCDVAVTGYKYSPQAGDEYKAHVQLFHVPTCASSAQNCTFTTLNLDDGFRGLTGLLFNATVGASSSAWALDDLRLDWYDDSCAAGQLRSRSA